MKPTTRYCLKIWATTLLLGPMLLISILSVQTLPQHLSINHILQLYRISIFLGIIASFVPLGLIIGLLYILDAYSLSSRLLKTITLILFWIAIAFVGIVLNTGEGFNDDYFRIVIAYGAVLTGSIYFYRLNMLAEEF